ncbi:hypothetical protein D3C85_1312810 [compost metagenome]
MCHHIGERERVPDYSVRAVRQAVDFGEVAVCNLDHLGRHMTYRTIRLNHNPCRYLVRVDAIRNSDCPLDIRVELAYFYRLIAVRCTHCKLQGGNNQRKVAIRRSLLNNLQSICVWFGYFNTDTYIL